MFPIVHGHLGNVGNIPNQDRTETMRMPLLYLMMGFTVGQLLMSARPVAAQGDCQVVFGATSKIFDTPAHAYVTMNMGGTTQTAESIYVAGAMYTKADGKWSPSTMSMKEMKDLDQKNKQTNKTTCRYLKDEAVNGEVTAVYSVHEQTPRGTSDSQIWISKAKGLPLRSEKT